MERFRKDADSFPNQLILETQRCSAASSDRHGNFVVQFFARRDEGTVGHASFAAPTSPPSGLLHNSARAGSTKKLFVSGVHPCRLRVNIMTGGPRLHAAMALHSRPKSHHCVPGGTSSSRSPSLCQRRRTTAAQQNGAPQSQQNCHQSPTHTDRRRSSDAVGWAPRVQCRERHGHVDAERAFRATVTGQGAGLPQQRDQEVVDVPQPQIEEFSARHSPERIDEQLLTVALVCVMQEKTIDVWELFAQNVFSEKTC